LRRLQWAEHVGSLKEIINTYRNQGKRRSERPTRQMGRQYEHGSERNRVCVCELNANGSEWGPALSFCACAWNVRFP
jgi:hypothetical protein